MENSIGFVAVQFGKIDEELIGKIAEQRGVSQEHVIKMFRHRVWSVEQFADLTGKSKTTINNLIVRGKQENLKQVKALSVCYPFPGINSDGPRFIVRDELSMGILEKSLK